MGGFAPNSEGARIFSENLGYKTVLSGSVNQGKQDPSQSLQMIQRPLITADELKALKKGEFIVSKTGTHPIRSELRLFERWGIELDKPYEISEKAARPVQYAAREEIQESIYQRYPGSLDRRETPIKVKILNRELQQHLKGESQ